MSKLSVLRLVEQIPDEASAYKFLEDMRWRGTPVCPHCGNDEKCYYLTPSNGVSRKTRTGAASQRRVWRCGGCRKQFSVLTGTVMHGTKIAVRTWVFVLFEMAANKNGVSAREIARKYDLCPRSAWFLVHRIREAMMADPVASPFVGTVVADETFIGGKPKNKHQQGRPARIGGAGGKAHLQPVLSLVNRDTGEIRSRVVPDVNAATLRKVIADQVHMSASHLHTDAGTQYRAMGKEFASHQWVDHSHYEYVRGDVTTNQAENFFSQLKRSLDGTHHHVSRVHLHRYLAEFDLRYSTRKMTDSERTALIVQRCGGRRLTYRAVVQ